MENDVDMARLKIEAEARASVPAAGPKPNTTSLATNPDPTEPDDISDVTIHSLEAPSPLDGTIEDPTTNEIEKRLKNLGLRSIQTNTPATVPTPETIPSPETDPVDQIH